MVLPWWPELLSANYSAQVRSTGKMQDKRPHSRGLCNGTGRWFKGIFMSSTRGTMCQYRLDNVPCEYLRQLSAFQEGKANK